LLRWLAAHEVAHRRHMNHGPEFRALEALLYGGDVAAARAELRALGPRLKRVGLMV
jgi:predicted metal-dependent hydrolase